MKKLYTLIFMLLTVAFSSGQTVVITGYIDSTCPSTNGRTMEMYVDGTIDFAAGTGWQLVIQNTGGALVFDDFLDLSPFSSVTNDFVYITNDLPVFEQEFGVQTYVLVDVGYFNGSSGGNGDDAFQIVDNTGAVIDRYGEAGVDGSGQPWEYTDSYFTRNAGATPNGGAFNIANWTVAPINSLDNTTGICNGGTALGTIVGTGSYEQNPLSVKQTDIEGFNLYPNPVTTGTVTISTTKNLTKDVAVFNVLGKQVLNGRLEENVLDVSSLAAGVYIIKITEDEKTATRKLVIK